MRPMPRLEVEDMAVEAIVPYARNAKVHTDEQVDQIVRSIEEFGFNDPVAVWHNEAGEPEIVEGHGRVLAAKKLGLETVPVITLDALTDEQRRAYALVHNKLTMNTGFDFEVLEAELSELSFEWEELGFDAFQIAEAATKSNDFNPRTDEIEEYSQRGEDELRSYNVIICCLDDEEQEWLAGLLGEDGRLKRLYMASELIGRLDA